MRTIFLLRHGKSSWKDTSLDDFDRPLAGRGRRAASAMGRFLKSEHIEPALILCSPAARTRETLSLMQEKFGTAVPIRFEKGIYMAEAPLLLRRLRGLSDSLPSVMIIGHNPSLEQLALLLVGDGGDEEETRLKRLMAEKFPTGTLAEIAAAVEHWHEVAAGCGRLKRFVRGRDLEGGAPR
jgi:phosphohistidine phosphatase